MATFIAFLRAVNVGKRQVKMAGLRTELEANGFTDVATFIASGNVRVSTTMRSAAKVEKELERVMEAWLGFDVPTMVRTPKQLVAAYDAGSDLKSPVPGSPRHYVSFLKDAPPATGRQGARVLGQAEGAGAGRRPRGAPLARFRPPEAHQRHDGEDPRNSRYGPRLEDRHQARRDLGISLIESAEITVIWTGCATR